MTRENPSIIVYFKMDLWRVYTEYLFPGSSGDSVIHDYETSVRLLTGKLNDRQQGEIISLYRNQGWWKAQDDLQNDLLQRLIAGSHIFVVAERDGVIIGIGRVISDGVSDAYIQDITVSPSCRRQGVGRKILLTLLKHLADDGIPWIGLIAEPGSIELYESIGFRSMPGSVPMLMVRET